MQSIEDKGTFEQAIASSEATAQAIAIALRSLIETVYPEVFEVPWPTQHTVGYGVGPKKMSEHFCYIGSHKQHVNLGFNYGAELPDPEGLLEGTGKLFRHVKIADLGKVDHPALEVLLQAAIKERLTALGRAT